MESSAEPRSQQGRKPALTAIILGMFAAVSLTGCPGAQVGSGGSGGGNVDDVPEEPATSPIRAEIITPSTGFGLSALDRGFSVLYSVDESATDVRGFRVPVADGSLNSAAIGERVITAANLAVGARQVFSFDPEEAGVGFFRVGIKFNLEGVEDDVESQAVIRVQGSPAPIFIQPTEALTQVEQGADVTISCDVRDPEGDVQWRMFYLTEEDLRNGLEDQLGTELTTGFGNTATFTLNTKSLDPGVYQFGISATDSGSSVATTAANGEYDRIVTIPSASVSTPKLKVVEAGQTLAPTIEVTEPATNVTIPPGGTFAIEFSGEVQPGATGTIEVFYDTDGDVVNGGLTFIAEGLPVSTTSVQFPTGLPSGTYFIGARIFDGINPEVTDYAAGKIIVSP